MLAILDNRRFSFGQFREIYTREYISFLTSCRPIYKQLVTQNDKFNSCTITLKKVRSKIFHEDLFYLISRMFLQYFAAERQHIGFLFPSSKYVFLDTSYKV